jgi:hypothetical protein
MRRMIVLALAMLAVLVLLGALAVEPARALPEYASQTGEPCATCHVSPSGGGARTPRGLAWVASGKPGQVPALTDALGLLGVRLKTDQKAYVATPGAVPPAHALELKTGGGRALQQVLIDREGN